MNIRHTLALLAVAAGLACGDDGSIADPAREPVAAVELVSPPAELIAGDSARITAVTRDSYGRPLSGRTITWESADPAVASVSQTGHVVALAAGITFISASSEGRVGRTFLRVVPRIIPVDRVIIEQGATLNTRIGQFTLLRAEARAADGTVLTGRPVEWSSSHPAIATVSEIGLVEAVALGSATITATIEGRTASIAVTVTSYVAWIEMDPPTLSLAVGEVRMIQAHARTAEGHVLNTQLDWSSSDTTVATVVTPGRVTAQRPGWTWIHATAEGKTGSTLVIVSQWSSYQLSTVNGAPLPATLYAGTESDSNGVERTVRYDAMSGMIRLLTGTDRYEQSFFFWIYREGLAPGSGQFITGGTVTYDWITGAMLFHPDDGSPEFASEPSAAGTLTVRQRYKAGAPEVVLKYQHQ